MDTERIMFATDELAFRVTMDLEGFITVEEMDPDVVDQWICDGSNVVVVE